MPPVTPGRLLLPTMLLGAVTLLFAWISGVEIYRWALLRNADTVTSAEITAEELNPCVGRGCVGNVGPYRIKYQFSTSAAADASYFYTGQVIFMERWVRVPRRVWEPAARSRRINVVYAPRDPRINQPAEMPSPSPVNAFGFALIALVSAVILGAYRRGHRV